MTRTVRKIVRSGGPVLMAALLVYAASTPAAADHEGVGHWSMAGQARAYIYYVDHTGSRWPVGTKVSEWNQAYPQTSAKIGLYYRTTCPGSGSNCIDVREYTNATSPATACNAPHVGCSLRTYTSPNYANHYADVRIYLNTDAANNTTLNRQITCHEIGHSLGLEHSKLTSCMNDPIATTTAQSAASHDFTALGSMYNHAS